MYFPAQLAVDGRLRRLALAVVDALHPALDHVPPPALLARQRLLQEHLDVTEVVAVRLHQRVRDSRRAPVEALLLFVLGFFGGRGRCRGDRRESEQVPLSHPREEQPDGPGDDSGEPVAPPQLAVEADVGEGALDALRRDVVQLATRDLAE